MPSTISVHIPAIPALNPLVDIIKPELKPTLTTDPEPTADTEPEPMPTTKPPPEATSFQELDLATQSDQVFEPVHTSIPVGVLVELNEEVSGHPHPPESEFSLPQSGVIDYLMTSCAQVLPPQLDLSSI